MTLDSISGHILVSARSQPFSVGLVTFSLQPSCPPIRPELTPAAPNLYRKRIATRARPEARDRSQIWNGRRPRNVASHRSIVAAYRAAAAGASTRRGQESKIVLGGLTVGSGRWGATARPSDFRRCQFPACFCRWRSARVRFMLADPRSQRCKKGTRHWGTSQPPPQY